MEPETVWPFFDLKHTSVSKPGPRDGGVYTFQGESQVIDERGKEVVFLTETLRSEDPLKMCDGSLWSDIQCISGIDVR
jgi:hypothetical protein